MESEICRRRACVLVFGDWGRSPRMQNHALSLTRNGFSVDVIAYSGSKPYEEILENERITHHLMSDVPNFAKYLPRLIVYFLKTVWQSFVLFFTLLKVPKPDFLLLQNPPSIPTLPVSWFVCWLYNCKLIVDYHNYGHTLLRLSLGHNHILVKLCAWCEKFFGLRATSSLCVTKAMKEDLEKKWGVRASVFYDCPPEQFHPISVVESHFLFMKLSENYPEFRSRFDNSDDSVLFTRFTQYLRGEAVFLQERPVLIASSTSWTEDEDFSILLHALEGYEKAASNSSSLPHLICAITGKGPQKAYYEKIIMNKVFHHVEIVTLWLKAEDYPTFLASADLGICLHKSSSGLDLPMKVVDMFGCCLPVCAVTYPCLGELVRHEINGLIFSNSEELCQQLQELLNNFPKSSTKLKNFRQNLIDASGLRWEENWLINVLPYFK